MTNCNKFSLKFLALKSKKVLGNFQGGSISSNGGVLLLRQIDKKLGLSKSISSAFVDKRSYEKIKHSIEEMLKQRIFALALGYEDLNDHTTLKEDVALQIAVEKDSSLASSSTLCRFENSFSRKQAIEIHKKIVDNFIKSFKTPPKKLVLDFDPTDLPVYGNQKRKAYHGYYKHDCFLPLHVFCEDKLLVSYLRPSDEDSAQHAWAILSLLTKRFRKEWPNVKIVFRADSAFCREPMLNWCDRNKVDYIVGIACNSRLQKSLQLSLKIAIKKHEKSKKTEQVFKNFNYKANSWKYERKIIGKAECSSIKTSTRTVVTSLVGEPKELYKKQYCPRGQMENLIKQQLLLFSYRVSCHEWWPNQFRLLLSSLAYVLLEELRSCYLKKTSFRECQVNTLRLKFLKIGAIIIKNRRKIKFYFSSSYPLQKLFTQLTANLNTS